MRCLLICLFLAISIHSNSGVAVNKYEYASKYQYGYPYQSKPSYKPSYKPPKKTGIDVQCGGKDLKITKLLPPMKVGESPYWNEKEGAVYFVDIYNGECHRYVVNEGQHYFSKIGEQNVGCIYPFKGKRGKYLITYGTQVCTISWSGYNESVQNFECGEVLDQYRLWPKFHLSDPKIAPSGQFVFFNIPPFSGNDTKNSTMYDIQGGEVTVLYKDIDVGQGTAWSPDGRTFYWMDSRKKYIYSSSWYPESKSIGAPKVLFDYKAAGLAGSPDSLITDKDGYIWLACNGAYVILKLDPFTGEIICSIKMPVSQPTNMVFGKCPSEKRYGERYCPYEEKNNELSCLYVTTCNTSATPSYDAGAFYRVDNVGAYGAYPPEADYKRIFVADED